MLSPVFPSHGIDRLPRVETNALSYRRLEVSFLKFIQPTYKCQDEGTVRKSLVDQQIPLPSFTEDKTKV